MNAGRSRKGPVNAYSQSLLFHGYKSFWSPAENTTYSVFLSNFLFLLKQPSNRCALWSITTLHPRAQRITLNYRNGVPGRSTWPLYSPSRERVLNLILLNYQVFCPIPCLTTFSRNFVPSHSTEQCPRIEFFTARRDKKWGISFSPPSVATTSRALMTQFQRDCWDCFFLLLLAGMSSLKYKRLPCIQVSLFLGPVRDRQ